MGVVPLLLQRSAAAGVNQLTLANGPVLAGIKPYLDSNRFSTLQMLSSYGPEAILNWKVASPNIVKASVDLRPG